MSPRRRPWRARRVAAFILLLLLLAALVGAFVAFQSFQKEIRASNRRVPPATKRVLAPSRDELSAPQLVLIVFDRASLLARTDPDRRIISFLSIPGSAYLRAPGGTTVAGVLGTAGVAGLVSFARSALDLQVTHIALLGPHDIAPLVDAVGGIQIHDASSFSGAGPPGRPAVLDGAEADRYLARAGPAGSLTRRARERAVLGAIITHLASGASVSKLPRLARTFSATVATDLSLRETLALALVRLRSKLSIQCGLPEGSTLERPQSKHILRQFEAAGPVPRKQALIFPANGCRTAPLSLRAPAAVIFFGKQALALYPFVPELAAVAIALDVMLLLALLGVPQALIGISRRRLRPGRVDDAKPESISAASVSEVLADRAGAYTAQSSEAPVAARAQVVRANSEVEATLERLADEIHPPVHPPNQPVEEEAPATPRAGTEPFMPTSPQPVPRRSKSFRREPSLRRSERLRAAAWRRLRHGGGFTEHPDAAWVLVGVAVAIFFGYLISQL
jgi:anionic cell wall polymer biosynthesis LytR-Cps2A-Psr (LCP) family protein